MLHGVYEITVTTDPYLRSIVVGWYGSTMINRFLAGTGPAHVAETTLVPGAPLPAITVTEVPTPRPNLSTCHALLAGTS